MTYPPQSPGPYGGPPNGPLPRPPDQYGQPQFGYPGGYGGYPGPPQPPKKKTGPIIAAIATAGVLVAAVLVTGLAWPGWFGGTDGDAAEAAPAGATSAAPEPENLTTPEGTAKALVARLNNQDVKGVAENLTCAAGQEKSTEGPGTRVEDDLVMFVTLDPRQPAEVRDTKTTFELIKVRPMDKFDRGFEPGLENQRMAEVTVHYRGLPRPPKNVDDKFVFRLTPENNQWLMCGLENTGSTPTDSGDPADPNNVMNAYIDAVNDGMGDTTGELICGTNPPMRTFTTQLTDNDATLDMDQEIARPEPDAWTATATVTATARGEKATLLILLSRASTSSQWCVNTVREANQAPS